MLPKSNRLNLKTELGREIFKYKASSTDTLDIFFNKKDKNTFRAAVVVPVKTNKLAVNRNKTKRAIFNLIKNHEISKKPADLLILVRKKGFILDKKRELDLISQLEKLLRAK